MPENCEYLILGAGPTGLGAALRLAEHGTRDVLVLDADSRVGGLAKSIRDEKGFVWDIGGHVQFSHYEYFDALMDSVIPAKHWLNHQRESWVWVRERFVPYPFQNNLRYLPKEETWKSLEALIEAHERRGGASPANFREWIHRTFGSGVAEIFMEPYNFKVWATPLEKMAYGWIGERVSVPDLRRVLGNVVLGRDDVSWGPNNTFRFPPEGGTGAIWEKVADRIGRDRFRMGARVVSVSLKDSRVTTEDGRTFGFRRLLNTMPLDRFAGIIEGFPKALAQRAAGLTHASTHIVGIGLEGRIPPHLAGKCWMYFPEANCPFYRATVFSHYSPRNVPSSDTQWSLMLEVSESPHKPVDRARVAEQAYQGCLATGLLTARDRVVVRTHFSVPYGYPVPTLDRDAILASLHPELEKHDLYSRGRFGGWKYEVSNQDHSLMQGVEWADRMILGTAEQTYECRKGLGGKEPMPAVVPVRRAG